jgi:virulence-associated protein VagC
MNRVYDLIYKRGEHNGKAQWAKCGVLIEKEGRKSIKLDLMPISKEWDGWLVVSERKAKEDFSKESEGMGDLEPF